MFSRNSLEISGNLVRQPMRSSNEDGKTIAIFVLAYNSVKNGNREPLYIDCVAYGETAELLLDAPVVGREYRCHGELLPNNYVGKNGKKIYKAQYRVKYLEPGMLPKKYLQEQDTMAEAYLEDSIASEENMDEDRCFGSRIKYDIDF